MLLNVVKRWFTKMYANPIKFNQLPTSKNRLKEFNTKLYSNQNSPQFQEISKEIIKQLPPIGSITTFQDLKEYSRIQYKLNIKQDSKVLEQILQLILIDQDGNFVLNDKLILHLISNLKINELSAKTKQLMEQIQLKSSQIQLDCIHIILGKINEKLTNKTSNMTQQTIEQLIKRIQTNNEVPYIKNQVQLQKLIEHFQKLELNHKNQLILLKLICQSHDQHVEFIQNICDQLEQQKESILLTYAQVLLKNIHKINQHQKKQLIKYLDGYFGYLDFSYQDIKEVNSIIALSPQFFQSNPIPAIEQFLEKIQINSKLLATQVNSLLYIIYNTKNYEYFKKQEENLEKYIKETNSFNIDQLVGIFAHLNQIYLRTKVFNQNVLAHLQNLIVQQIQLFNSKQLFLLFKACFSNQSQTVELQRKIRDLVEEGAFNDTPDYLINYVANQIKLEQRLFSKDILYTVEISESNFGEWCNLVNQTGTFKAIDENIQDKFLLNFKRYGNSIKANQLFYVFSAALQCDCNIQEFLLERQQKLKSFIKCRILHLLMQSQEQGYEKLIEQYTTDLMENKRFLYEDFDQLDKGLLSFILFTASLMNNMNLYEHIIKVYEKELRQVIQDCNKQYNIGRNRVIGGGLMNQVSNQSVLQLYQSFLYYELNGNKSIDMKEDLKNVIKRISETQQMNQISQQEEKTQEILDKMKIEYIYDYCEILPFRIDFYLKQRGIGIECNGCSHYIKNKLRQSDILKYRLLKQQGIEIKVIKYNTMELEQQIIDIIQ